MSQRRLNHDTSEEVKRRVRMTRLCAPHLCAARAEVHMQTAAAAAAAAATAAARWAAAAGAYTCIRTSKIYTRARRRVALSAPLTHRGGSRNASASHALALSWDTAATWRHNKGAHVYVRMERQL